MAEVVANSLIGKVVDSLFGAAIKEIGYMYKCTENVENFRNVAGNLKHMKGRVQQRIKRATDNGEDLLDGVEEWMHKAVAQISMADEFLVEEANASKKCFNLRLCVNLVNLHHYGKKAITMGASLQQHQKDGEPYETSVSVHTRTPGLQDFYQKKNLDDIMTHKSALVEIIKAIEDEKIQTIGIYGLGGVGKTTLAKEALAIAKNQFADCEFVTISQNVDVEKIKEKVEASAKRVLKGEKILIVLDDMWKGLYLEDLGIPDRMNCKILLTTRMKNVCVAMKAQTSICVNPLREAEAWILFKRVVGENVETNNSLKLIAKKVLTKCGGLPLIIQAVGTTLKDKEEHLWEATNDRLQSHAPSNISSDIRRAFTCLKLSYDYLESEESRSCFLLCSMFPQDSWIPLEYLVYYMVCLGKFNDLKSIEDARNRVRIAVDVLESSFLLLNVHNEFHTKMHVVVRDLSLLIASEGEDRFLVEAGKSLTEWLPRKDSLESYTGISLMKNKIRKLPNYEVHFPRLDILLIQGNRELSTISDEFIRGMKEPRVLDMAYTGISSLPQSLKLLTKLRMLNLGGSRNLHEISILGQLKNLEILIFNGEAIDKEIPQEIGQLINLRRLEIQGCVKFNHKSLLGVISKFLWLEELGVELPYMHHKGIFDFLVEVMKLSKLTNLNLWLPCFDVIPEGVDFGKFKGFVIQIGGKFNHGVDRSVHNLKHLILVNDGHFSIPVSKSSRRLIEVSSDITLRSMEYLHNIVPILYQEIFNNLVSIRLQSCHNVTWMVDTSNRDQLDPSNGEGETKEKFFMNIKYLALLSLHRLKFIWNGPDQYISFSNLLMLRIGYCGKLAFVFTVRVAQGLFNLQKLVISYCDDLDEVIGAGDEDSNTNVYIVFPSLAEISLYHLSRLKHFYSGYSTMEYPSLVKVDIEYCTSMKMWGGGIHRTHHLKFVSNVPLDGHCTINNAVANIYKNGKQNRKLAAQRSHRDVHVHPFLDYGNEDSKNDEPDILAEHSLQDIRVQSFFDYGNEDSKNNEPEILAAERSHQDIHAHAFLD